MEGMGYSNGSLGIALRGGLVPIAVAREAGSYYLRDPESVELY